MKRAIIIALFIPVLAMGQKQVKPNVNKALTLWRTGKLGEAKEMIDLATTYEKTMNDGKTWYYRGLIYASLDTTSKAEFKSLAPNALQTSIESFAKADQLAKAGVEYSIPPDVTNLSMPLDKKQQLTGLADYYLNAGINAIQKDEADYQESIAAIEKSKLVFEKAGLQKYSNDTLAYFVLGLAAQNVAQEKEDSTMNDVAIDALNTYLKKGGKSKDAYIILYNIYSGPKENKEKALEVVRQAKKAVPSNTDFPRMEIGLLIDMNRVQEAKEGLEQAVARDPNDKVLHFYLAYANASLKNKEEAVKHYKEALRVDPNYFEAQYYLTQVFLEDVDVISKEINQLGISAADAKKKQTLFQQRVKKCEEAIPYLEATERMKAPDKETQINVLEKLQLMYYYIADEAKQKQVKAKLKALGADVDE